MVIIVFYDGNYVRKVVGLFENLELAQKYLAEKNYRKISQCYWISQNSQSSVLVRAQITAMQKP